MLFIVHICTRLTAHTARKHALKKAASVWCAFGIWVENKVGTVGLDHCWSEVFFMFSFRNVKVAAQGHYCVSEEKTPLGWFKG